MLVKSCRNKGSAVTSRRVSKELLRSEGTTLLLYTCLAAEWEASSPGDRSCFETSLLPVDSPNHQEHHWKDFFWTEEGILGYLEIVLVKLILKETILTQCLLDPRSSSKTSRKCLQTLQFLQTTYSGRMKIWTIYLLFRKWLASTRQPVDQWRG